MSVDWWLLDYTSPFYAHAPFVVAAGARGAYKRSMRRRPLIGALAALALAPFFPVSSGGAASERTRPWKSTLLAGHPLAGTIWDAAAGQETTREAIYSALRDARYRLLGEVHDNADHHDFQLGCLVALGEDGLRPVVAFEQLDRESDPPLQELLAAGGATPDAMAEAAGFDRKSWRWGFYRPLFETALRYGMAVRAANLSRAVAGRVVRAGLDTLRADGIPPARIEAVWSEERERALRALIADAHCQALSEAIVPGMALAQRARDGTLAAALLEPGPDGAALIAGNGHVRRDLAVPLYLRDMRPAESVVSVGLLEVEEGMMRPEEYLSGAASGELQYDFVCFTPRWDRPDPCGKLKPRRG